MNALYHTLWENPAKCNRLTFKCNALHLFGAAFPAAELMRRGVRFAGRPLRAREPRAVRGTAVLLRVFESRSRSGRSVETVSLWSLYTRGRVWRWFFALLLASLLGFRDLRDLAREKETAHPVLYAATPSAR